MSLLSRFFSGDDDPTRDWPRSDEQSPQLGLERQALESFSTSVKFGAPLEAMRFLGRPDHYKSSREGFCTLTYDRWGLLVEFEQGTMYQVSFLIGEMHQSGKRPELVLAEPRGPDGLGLNPRTTKDELLHRFGEPRNAAGLRGNE